MKSLGEEVADRIVASRTDHGPFRDIGDLGHRVPMPRPTLEALATAGAFTDLGTDRRRALWAAGAAAQTRPEHLPAAAVGLDAPALPGLSQFEITAADMWATGISPDTHPVHYLRAHLTKHGAITTAALAAAADGDRVWIGGAVTHRQRPATAGGVTFLNLEDETGMANVVVSQGLWQRQRDVARNSKALLIRGRVQAAEGVVTLVADRLVPIDLSAVLAGPSRDFR